jgi:hypothetical protein
MLCHCKRNLTDGFVLAEEIGVLAYPDSLKTGQRDAGRLVEVGLVVAVEGGYMVPGFLKRNKSKAQVEEVSAAKAASGRQGGKRSGQVRRGQANAKQSASHDDNQVASPSEANAKQGASVCLNTEVIGHSAEVIGQTDLVPPTAGADKPRRQPPTSDLNVGHVVAAFVDGAAEAGLDAPSASIKARVGKEARALLAEKKPIEGLIESARRMGAGEWNDLAVQYRKDNARANGRSVPGQHQPYTNPADQSAYDERY